MNVYIIYKDASDHRRNVEDWYHMLTKENGGESDDIKMLEANEREAQRMMQLYDVMEYPAILVTKPGDGAIVQSWKGEPLPRVSEVLYFARS